MKPQKVRVAGKLCEPVLNEWGHQVALKLPRMSKAERERWYKRRWREDRKKLIALYLDRFKKGDKFAFFDCLPVLLERAEVPQEFMAYLLESRGRWRSGEARSFGEAWGFPKKRGRAIGFEYELVWIGGGGYHKGTLLADEVSDLIRSGMTRDFAIETVANKHPEAGGTHNVSRIYYAWRNARSLAPPSLPFPRKRRTAKTPRPV